MKNSKGRDPMLMRGHLTKKQMRRRLQRKAAKVKERDELEDGAKALKKVWQVDHNWRPSGSEHEKAEIFAPQVFSDGSASLPLTAKEKDCINTMIDFFRSSGEEEHLDPDVYEAIATKLGNGREPKAPLVEAREHMKWLVEALWDLGLDTVGLDPEDNTSLDRRTAQHELHERAKKAFFALEAAVAPPTLSDGHQRDILYACSKALGAIDGVLGADGYQSTETDDCECDDFDSGTQCQHTAARKAQNGLRSALKNAGYVEDNFGWWGRP